jgi:predicted metal-binding membrane protein
MTILATPRRDPVTLDVRAWVRAVGRPGPERWLWWLSGAAWGFLLVGAAASDLEALGLGGSGGVHDHMQMGSSSVAASVGPVVMWVVMWVAMVVATMLPLVVWNVRAVALRSPRQRRARATREVVAGWAVAWAVGSVVLIGGIWVTQRFVGPAWALVAALIMAAGWQLTPRRRRALARCHRTLAPPLGPGAPRACRELGRQLGRDCCTTCWPLMAAMGVGGHELLVMVLLAWLSWRDRRLPADQPGHATSLVVLVLAGGLGLLAL